MPNTDLFSQKFVNKVLTKWGNIYNLNKIIYKGCFSKIKLFCKIHKFWFFTYPSKVIRKGNCCPKCSRTNYNEKRKIKFISQTKIKHENKCSYSKVNYVDSWTKVIITCIKHGDYEQIPIYHLHNRIDCPECLKLIPLKRRKTTQQYLDKIRAKWGHVYKDKYSYEYTNCIKANLEIIIVCKVHGKFKRTAMDHLNGHGCPKCVDKLNNFSKVAIDWIDQYSYSHRLKNVQHALNGKEYNLPGTNIRVDGYHHRSKTVFEFHGSCWHGDPKIYKSRSQPNPYSNKTAKQLYKETLDREDLIVKLGYKLIVIWESDYYDNHEYSYILYDTNPVVRT